MKKVLLTALATLGMISTTISFAADMQNGAGKAIVVKSTHLTPRQMKMHVVDVTVNNRSDSNIWVQNAPYVNNLVESGGSTRLYSDAYGQVQVAIVNGYNNAVVFNEYVCNRAVIRVLGGYNNLYVQLDNSQCF